MSFQSHFVMTCKEDKMYLQYNKGTCGERISYFQTINEGIPLVDAAISNWFALHSMYITYWNFNCHVDLHFFTLNDWALRTNLVVRILNYKSRLKERTFYKELGFHYFRYTLAIKQFIRIWKYVYLFRPFTGPKVTVDWCGY